MRSQCVFITATVHNCSVLKGTWGKKKFQHIHVGIRSAFQHTNFEIRQHRQISELHISENIRQQADWIRLPFLCHKGLHSNYILSISTHGVEAVGKVMYIQAWLVGEKGGGVGSDLLLFKGKGTRTSCFKTGWEGAVLLYRCGISTRSMSQTFY